MNAWNRFFELTLLPARMVLLRVSFFTLLAFDLWLVLLEHAPRFGAGEFNASQIPFLDPYLPVPTPAIITAAYLLGGFLALRVAMGVAVRASMIGLTVCYFGVYLWSQSDSYQHHYLVGLLLVLFCCVPARAWGGLDRPAVPTPSWGMRLVLLQLAILYFWTAVTKLTPAWLDGSTLQQILSSADVRESFRKVAESGGWAPSTPYMLASWAAVVAEVTATLVYLFPRFRLLGLLFLPAMHIGIEVMGFDIEWFSYYMIALNVVLLLPDRALLALERVGGKVVSPVRSALTWLGRSRPLDLTSTRMLALCAAALVAAILYGVPLEGTTGLLIAGGVFVLAAQWPRGDAPDGKAMLRAAAQIVLALVLLLTVRQTDVAYNYYRLWGGDERRRGDLETSARLYEKANALKAHGPARHFQLAQVYESLNRADEARSLFEEDVRRHQEALAEAEAAVRSTPTNAGRQFDVGELHADLVERYAAVARVRQQAGDAAGAEEARGRRSIHLDDARKAFRAGLSFAPNDSRGLTGLRQLERSGRP